MNADTTCGSGQLSECGTSYVRAIDSGEITLDRDLRCARPADPARCTDIARAGNVRTRSAPGPADAEVKQTELTVLDSRYYDS